MNKLKIVLILSLLMTYQFVMAAGGEAHGDNHIPVKTILTQIANLGILVVALFFLTKTSIKEMFKARLVNYRDQADKTEKAAQQAEAALSDVKNRIDNLKKTEVLTIENAKKEAELLKNKIIDEAKIQATKIKGEAEIVISAEVHKAKNEIREQLIESSMAQATLNIKNAADSITKRSEAGFVNDILQTKTQVN